MDSGGKFDLVDTFENHKKTCLIIFIVNIYVTKNKIKLQNAGFRQNLIFSLNILEIFSKYLYLHFLDVIKCLK